MNQDNTMGDVARRRHPRLIAAIQHGAGLSEPDAVNAVVEYRDFGITTAEDTMEPELQTLGGPPASIRSGICRRHRRDPRDQRRL
jgi:hypothetical protein